MGKVIFREIQRFKQRWLWLIVTVILLIVAAQVYQIVTDDAFGQDLFIDILLIMASFIPVGLFLLIYYAHLTTEVRIEGIYYKFFPLHLTFHVIKWEQIKTYYIREYNPVKEYGSGRVGLFLFSKDKAFTVLGNKGLQIELKDGSKVLLGTQKPEDLMQYIIS